MNVRGVWVYSKSTLKCLTVFVFLFFLGRTMNRTSQHWTVCQRTQWPWRLRSLVWLHLLTFFFLYNFFFYWLGFLFGAMHHLVVTNANGGRMSRAWVSMATIWGHNCNAHLVQIFSFLPHPDHGPSLSPHIPFFVTVNKRSSVNS